MFRRHEERRFLHIDLRRVVQPGDFVDELHLSSEGFLKVAEKFHTATQQADRLPPAPIVPPGD